MSSNCISAFDRGRALLVLIAGWALGSTALSAALHDPIKTTAGYIAGTMIGAPGNAVRVYRGIPYAAPPVKELRWQPPQSVTPWQGIRESTQFGPFATQYTWNGPWMGEIQDAGMSEDCLHLNVLTPAKNAQGKLPVIVWLHDGGLDAGSGNRPLYNRADLPQQGALLVTVSHRIGVMGFLAHPEMAAESPHGAAGNYGMLDIVAALRWVQQNIAAFGGDPTRVTVFGQSGGGMKVMWLLTSPLAKGLFHRAIIAGAITGAQGVSGLARDVRTQQEALVQGTAFAAKLGARNLAEMRARSWSEVVAAVPRPGAPYDDPLKMRFTVDGWSMPGKPFEIAAQGGSHSVPILMGGGEGETNVHKGTALWAPNLIKANPNLFVYVFSHLPSHWKKSGSLQAYHGLELFYQFGGLDTVIGREQAMWLAPANFPKEQSPGFDSSDDVVAEFNRKIWVQFATTGRPDVAGIPAWPAFSPAVGKDKYLDLSVQPAVRSGFMEKFDR